MRVDNGTRRRLQLLRQSGEPDVDRLRARVARFVAATSMPARAFSITLAGTVLVSPEVFLACRIQDYRVQPFGDG